MAKKYQQNLRNKLKEHFREHPYFRLCKAVYKAFQEECSTMVMTPEELFQDASWTLDRILKDGDISAELCQELWTDKFTQYRERDEKVGGKEDATKTEVAALFYVVMYALQAVNHSHYRGTLQRTLHDSIFRLYYKGNIKRRLEFEKKLHEPVNLHSTEMMAWMEVYIDTDECLSDQIAATAAVKSGKSVEEEFVPRGQTFTKTALLTDKLIDIMGQRLARANKLNASPDDLRKLFSGIDQQFTMTWMGTGGELRDLFKMLTDKKCQFAKPHRGYQKILQSHFLDATGHRFDNLHGDKSIESFQAVIDDCSFLLQHLTDSMTAIMKQLIRENEDALREAGYFDKVQAAKQAGMSIRNKRR